MHALSIGWAERDVSTTEPIDIPGQFHTRISQGIHDPVTVTALAIDNGADSVIFLSADIVVIRAHLLDRIRDRVAALDPAIPALKILMNATHTHAAPTTYGNRTGWESGSVTGAIDAFPHDDIAIADADAYQAFFIDKAAEAVVEAWRRRAPGGISFGYGFAVVAHSRRVVYFDDVSKRPGAIINSTHGVDGHAKMYGKTNDPMFSHYEAGADPFINLLYTFDAKGALTGAIVNVPCPSQNSEGARVLSASFWHEARESIRAAHGRIFILPQCAAGGDLSPRPLHYLKAEARRFALKYGSRQPETISEEYRRRDIAERISAAFSEVLAWAKRDIRTDAPLRHTVKTVHLQKRFITPDEAAHAKTELAALEQQPFTTDGDPGARLDANSRLVASRNRCRRILARFETQERKPRHAMELHALRIGDTAFASNQFELYMDFMHRIQARSPFVQTFIVQLAGTPGPDGGTYLATERGAWGRGYSASMYCNLVSPQGGQELVEETLAALQGLQDADPA